MDGNGRWAKNGIFRDSKATDRVSQVFARPSNMLQDEISSSLLCIVSRENWRRPKAELDFLMLLRTVHD